MFLLSRKNEWWEEPSLRKQRIRISSHLHSKDPMDMTYVSYVPPPSRVGAFAHSRHWTRYGRLTSIETGYITPLFSLDAIGKRYGLSNNGMRYFRKYILPEPYDIVRRRSVSAHHWSRITLIVLDTVLRDLEYRGFHQFLKTYDEHVDLVHRGVSYLEEYYESKAQDIEVDVTDKHGVQWVE